VFRQSLFIVFSVILALPSIACAAPSGSDEASHAGGSDVVAKIGDRVITEDELDDLVGPNMLRLRQQMYDMKSKALDTLIFDILAEQAAEAEGITKDEWLQVNVKSKTENPSEEEIKKVMDQYRSRLAKDDAQARQQVVGFLKQQSTNVHEQKVRRELADKAGVVILLEPPRVQPVVTAESTMRGPFDAPVTLIEYTDFECPFCSRVQGTLQEVRKRYGDSVNMVFKNLPLAMHKQARFAAEAALCAGDQDGFWPLHDWLFANFKNISKETVMAQVEELGLDVDQVNACLDEGKYAAEIDEDTKEANSFGITGTPGFVINGRVLTGAQPIDAFVKIIDDELRRAGLPVPDAPIERPDEK
jgi:protein-disulfide isomerase